MSHKGCSHVGLVTRDLDKTREFYEGVMTNTTQCMLADVRKLVPDHGAPEHRRRDIMQDNAQHAFAER